MQIECRGAVGETAFHVCFLMGTAIHLHLAKRMLKFYPLLLNDIYLSDEYYGENVLHMSCVAEDPSVVKWLLDIGADISRSVGRISAGQWGGYQQVSGGVISRSVGWISAGQWGGYQQVSGVDISWSVGRISAGQCGG